MIAELAAANAAFSVIKAAISNGKELYDAGDSILNYFDAKTKLQKTVNEKPVDKRSDLEEFLALEQLKKQEEELKQMMIYTGRSGMWTDWLAFQAQAKKKRDAEEAAKIARRKRKQKLIIETSVIVGAGLVSLSAIGAIFYSIATY